MKATVKNTIVGAKSKAATAKEIYSLSECKLTKSEQSTLGVLLN